MSNTTLESVVRAESVTFTRRDKRFTLGPLSLSIDPRTVVALLGRNGAGKSTLLDLLSGGLRPTAGALQVSKTDNHQVSLVPQSATLPPFSTVQDFLSYVALLEKIERKHRGPVVAECLETIGLSDKGRARIGSLSGGMKRRVLIGQALIGGGDLILLDEPSAGLDLEQRQELKALIAKLAAFKTVIVSTHIIEDVAQVADKVLLLEGGQVHFWGASEEFLGDRTGSEETTMWADAFARSIGRKGDAE